MKIALRLVLVAALIALGIWLWTVLFPGPEKVIRKRLAEVARLASFAPNEGALARVSNVQKLASYFAPEVEIAIDLPDRSQPPLASRDEIMKAAMGARTLLSSLKVQVLDLNVALAPDKQSAVVDLTVRANAPGERDFMVQEMNIYFKKINGEWLIIKIETVRVLSRASAGRESDDWTANKLTPIPAQEGNWPYAPTILLPSGVGLPLPRRLG